MTDESADWQGSLGPFRGQSVIRYAATIPVSDELIEEAAAAQDAFTQYVNATPQQRAEWRREASRDRQRERDATAPVELTLDRLLDKLGFGRAYAEHLVQPYCGCDDSYDGWYRCQHAVDLGLETNG